MRHASDRDPFREATVAFVTSLAVAFLLASMFAFGTLLDFPPMKGLKALDDSLAQLLWEPPGPEAAVKMTPIYFVDIDDKTIEAYAQERNESPSRFVGKSTPRDLIADLVKRVRKEKPAVVVLDIDLRDPRSEPGDSELRKELRNTDSASLLLIPRIIYPAGVTSCSNIDRPLQTPHAWAFQTIVEDAINPEQVKFAHAYFELDSLGDVRGICPSLIVPTPLSSGTANLELNALSVEAVRHTRFNSDNHPWWFLEEQTKRTMQRVQFRVGGDRKNPLYASSNGRELYQQLSAASVREAEWSHNMAGAIVIIGTSHKGSEEFHSTPLGQMPGSVVHANVMLQLQIGPVTEMPSLIQVMIKGILCIGLAFIHARVYVYNIARAKLGGVQGDAHHLRYFVFAAVLTLVGTIIYYAIVVRYMVPDAVAVMGPILVVCAELLYEMVKLAEELVDKKGKHIVDTLSGFR